MNANTRISHTLVQGTDEWLAFRAVHFGASEAGAMLGISPKTTRDELLRLKHLGISKEFSDYVQTQVLDKGHTTEAAARPLAEAVIGEELYPVTMSYGKLSASCDGLTMLGEVAMEHKLWNEPMAALMRDGIVPPEHMPQCQQVLHVTGADKLLFVLSDGTPERFLHVWVYPDTVMQRQLVAGWAQFQADLDAYVLPAAKPVEAVGRAPDMLPSVVVEIRGEVVSSNLLAIKDQAVAVFKGINRNLVTDQDFADAATTVQWCEDIEERLAAAKAHALGQAKSIDEVFSAIDEIIASSATARIALKKLVDRRKEERKGELVAGGVAAVRDHMMALNTRLDRPLMPTVPADFAGVIKGKRSFELMGAAVNAEVARVKVAANEIADRIEANVKSLANGDAPSWEHLFPDLAAVCHKPSEDFANLLAARIAKHNAAKAAQDAADAAAKAIKDAQIASDLAAEQRARDQVNLVDVVSPVVVGILPAGTVVDQQLTGLIPAAAPATTVVNAEVPRRARGMLRPAEAPTLKLGEISARLGFTLTAAEIEAFGFLPSIGERNTKLYRESDFDGLCAALIGHIANVRTNLRGVPA